MSYEIPQQLEYSEKIVFGLTFKQLGYAGIGLILTFLILKQQWPTITKLSMTIPIIVLTGGFVFFNWTTFIKNFLKWRKKRTIYLDEENIKKYLEIKDIGTNFAVVNKRKVAIVKVTPINFSIRAEGERETVIRAFQKFLNSLDFPIQFMMTTENMDLQKYLSALSERAQKTSSTTKNKLFTTHYNQLKKFLLSIIENQKIRNRSFYVVIPEFSGLDVQVKIIEERLNNAGLRTKRLNGAEITNLMLSFFKVNKEFGSLLKNYPDYLDNEGIQSRIITAFGYPRSVEAGFLDKIVTAEGDFDLSIHIEPYPIERIMVNLNRELQKQRADLYSAETKGTINPSLEIKYADTRKILDELQKGADKLFHVSLYIHCKAENEQNLSLLSKKVEAELNSLLIIPKTSKYKMLQGLKSVAPFANDELKVQRNITTHALSAFFPFTSKFLEIDEKGVWFGLNKTKIPIIKDVFGFSNPNGTILASSGAGKSYLAKLFIARQLLNGVKVMVIDPQGEYTDLVNAYEGQLIELSRESKNIINPLDLMGHDYAEKRLSLIDLMKVMLGDLSEVQKGFIDKAIGLTYKKKKITENDTKSWKNKPPILKDLLNTLKNLLRGASEMEKTSIRSLINRLEIYVTGVFKFLNQHTKIDFNNRFVCFNINKLPNQVKPVLMFLVLDYIYAKMKKDIQRKMLVIDEAWTLLSRTEDAGYIFEIVKTCRKFNLALLLINQEVEGLLASQAGKSVLANSSYTFLLKQKPAVISQLKKTFDLSEAEKNYLLGANVGEGLLITEQDHSEIKIVASEQEHELITTNADEKLQKKGGKQMKSKQELAPEQPEFAPKRLFYEIDKLSEEQKKSLQDKGFKEFEAYSVVSDKIIKCYIQPIKEPEYLFHLQDTAECIQKWASKVNKHLESEKPSITYEYKGEEFAIQVVTGTEDPKELQKKVKFLNKKYGEDGWHFLLTDSSLTKKYSKLGNVMLPKK